MLTTTTFDPRLDLASHVGQRVATYRWQLVDGLTDQPLGDLHPIRDPTPTLTHDTTRAVKRSIDGVSFGRVDTAAINPITDRVRLYMVIAGTSYPLGRYMFTDATEFTSTGGNLSNDVLLDEMFIVDQQIDTGFASTAHVDVAARALLDGLPIQPPLIEATSYPAVGGYGAGTRRGQILDALAAQGDYFTPWMNHQGRLTMIRTIDPATAVPTFDFDAGHKVIAFSIQRTSDILAAPNRFTVISNSGDADAAPIVGTYDVPASAPHSIAQRGFVISDVRDLQIADPVQATAAARNLGIRQTIFERVSLATAPDPRHDSYDVIVWQGVQWLELGWAMTLHEGAPMQHIMRRSYQ